MRDGSFLPHRLPWTTKAWCYGTAGIRESHVAIELEFVYAPKCVDPVEMRDLEDGGVAVAYGELS